jgi:hypothetical protein
MHDRRKKRCARKVGHGLAAIQLRASVAPTSPHHIRYHTCKDVISNPDVQVLKFPGHGKFYLWKQSDGLPTIRHPILSSTYLECSENAAAVSLGPSAEPRRCPLVDIFIQPQEGWIKILQACANKRRRGTDSMQQPMGKMRAYKRRPHPTTRGRTKRHHEPWPSR